MDLAQILLLKFGEHLEQFFRVFEVQLILIEIIRHLNQVQVDELIKGQVPVSWGHLGMVRVVFAAFLLHVAGSFILASERVNHLLIVMNLVIRLEDDVVVELGVRHVLSNPPLP